MQAIQSDTTSGLEALRSQSTECVPILLECVKLYYSNDEVRNLAALLLTPLVTNTHVSEALRALKPGIQSIDSCVADEPLNNGDALDRATMSLAVFANIPALRQYIVDHNGIEDLITLLKTSAINSSVNDPTLESVLASSLRTLASVAVGNGDGDDSNKVKIMNAKGIKATMQTVKTHPNWQKSMVPEALRIVNAEVSTGNETLVENAVNQGAIDICVSAMRTAETTSDVEMMKEAISSIVELTRTAAGASLALRKGATRQLISMLKNHADDPLYSKCVHQALLVLQRVAKGNDQDRETLAKQKCSDVVMSVMPHLDHDEGDLISKQICASILSMVVTAEEAQKHMVTLQKVANGQLTDPNEIIMTIDVVSNLASVGENQAMLTESGVASSLVSTIASVASQEAGVNPSKSVILSSAVRGLGKVAKYTDVGVELNATQWVAHVLRTEADHDASLASLECIRDMSSSAPHHAQAFSEQNTVELVTWKMASMPQDQAIQLAGMEALNAMSGRLSASYATTESSRAVSDKIYNNNGVALSQTILTEHLIAPETAEMSEIRAAVQAVLVLESVASCGEGLSSEAIRQVLDMATAHLFGTSTLNNELKVQLMRAVVSIHKQTAALSPEAALDMDRKGVISKIITSIAKDTTGMYSKDMQTMKDVLSLLSTVTNALPEGTKANLKSNLALDLVSTAIGYYPVLVSDETNRLISTLVDKEVIGQYAITAQTHLDLLMTDGASIANVSALTASIETLASMSGALDASDTVVVQNILMMARNALPVLQHDCEPSKMQEKGISTLFDLVGRLQPTMEVASYKIDEKEALSFVEAMENTSSAAIQASAIQATTRTATNIGSIKTLAAAGAIEQLTKACNADTGNDKSAAEGIAQMTKIALEEFDQAGNELIIQIMEANADCNQLEGLQNCVTVLSTTDKGRDALTALVSKSSANKNAKVQAVVALSNRKLAGNTVELNVASKAEVNSLMAAAAAAPGTKGVVVMSCVNIGSASTARQMTDNGAIEMLKMGLAQKEIGDGVEDAAAAAAGGKAAVETLKKLISSSKKNNKTEGQTEAELKADQIAVGNKLRDLKIAASIAAALKGSDDPNFSNDCISLLQELTSLAGMNDEDGMGLDEDSLNLIMMSAGSSGANQDSIDNLMHSLANTSDLARSMISVGGVVDDAQVEVQLQDTLTALASISDTNSIAAVIDPSSGKTYYVNRTSNETSWEKPQELVTLERNIDRLVDMCEIRGKEIKDLDEQLTTIVKAIEIHSDKQEVVTKLITVINSLALNDANCTKIAENGGIATVLRALHKSITAVPTSSKNGVTDPQLALVIVQCLKLISRFAINDRFKRALAEANGIELVDHAVKSCLDIDKISQHGVSCLGNLAFNFPTGVERMVTSGVIKTLESVLQRWTTNVTVCEVTLVTMSNIMFRNDPIKKELGLTCGDEVVSILKTLVGETRVVVAAMRAMGNLGSLESNVNWMLKNGAVANIIAAMEHPANKDKDELIQTAIDVIGNLASVEDEDDDEESNASDMYRIHEAIMVQGGVRGIVNAMKGPCSGNSAVLMSSLETLAALSGVESLIMHHMVPLDLLPLLVDTMKQFDWDGGIMERACCLIVALTYFEECVDDLADLGVMNVLVSCLDQHDDHHEILHNCQIAFTNMAINYEEQEYIVNHGALEAMLAQLTKKPEESASMEDKERLQELHLETITTLTRLACTDEFSEAVGTKGMSEIMGTYDTHVAMNTSGTVEFIASLFTLVSQLAFHKDNLKYVMQSGGVKCSIQAIERFSEDSSVILHALQVIDNCGTASPDLAHMVTLEGGTKVFDHIISENKFEDCVDAAKSAKLGIDAMVRSSQSVKLTKSGQAVVQKNMLGHISSTHDLGTDALTEHKARVTRGNIFSHWGEGGQRFVWCTSDMTNLSWKKQDSKRAKDTKSIGLASVTEVVEGCRSGGHKKGTKSANPDRAFYLISKDGSKSIYIDLEASTKIERDRWVESLERIVEGVKNGTV